MISAREVRSVAVRKALHFLIALVPSFAEWDYNLCVLFLCAGTVFYAYVETFRYSGDAATMRRAYGFIARITIFASHRRDKDRLVLGPLTLGAGALASILIFPPGPAAAAIYALAAGDGLAGLAGRAAGRLRPKFLHGKSVEGSLICFAAIFVTARLVLGSAGAAAVCAFSGMIAEALPLEDFDNILLPCTVGLAATACL